MEQSVVEGCVGHFHAVHQNKFSLKLAGCNAAVQIIRVFVHGLFTTNTKLAVLPGNLQVLLAESGNRNRYSYDSVIGMLNVIRRIGLIRVPGNMFHQLLNLIKTQQKRTVEKCNRAHVHLSSDEQEIEETFLASITDSPPHASLPEL